MSATALCGSEHPGLAWLDGGATMICTLPPGHRGYHFGGGSGGIQPWPRKKGFIHLPGLPELPNELIGIRAHGGFCNGKHPTHGECSLRWRHPGPCANRGHIWKPTGRT